MENLVDSASARKPFSLTHHRDYLNAFTLSMKINALVARIVWRGEERASILIWSVCVQGCIRVRSLQQICCINKSYNNDNIPSTQKGYASYLSCLRRSCWNGERKGRKQILHRLVECSSVSQNQISTQHFVFFPNSYISRILNFYSFLEAAFYHLLKVLSD